MGILVGLAVDRHSSKLAAAVVAEAKARGAAITALCVRDPSETDRLAQIRNNPDIPASAQDDVVQEIEAEHRRILDDQVLALVRAADGAGVAVSRLWARGPYEEQVGLEARSGRWDVVFSLRHPHGVLVRIWGARDDADVVRQAK